MTDHEHNSTSAGNTGKTPEKAKAPKDPGTALITTGKTPEAAKASKNSGNAPAGSGKAPEKAKASGTTPKTNGRVTDKTKAPAKASGNASANAGKAPAANAPKASNTPVNSGKVQDKAKTSKAPAAAFTKASKAPEPVKASKVSPSVPGNPGKTPEAKKPNAAAPVSSGKGTVVSKASVEMQARLLILRQLRLPALLLRVRTRSLRRPGHPGILPPAIHRSETPLRQSRPSQENPDS